MKYIRVHTIIWFILCLIFLIAEIILFSICFVILFLWDFRKIKWKEIFYEDFPYLDNYEDYTPLDTFIRHLNYFDKK